MERKNYNKPFMVFEKFTPQEYVAACNEYIVTTRLGTTFWADLVTETTSGYYYSLHSDGIINAANVERFDNGSAPTGLLTTAYGADAQGQWFEHMTLYTKVTSSSIPSGSSYTDTRYMVPLAGYTDVAIYIGKKGVASYIYVGNGGSAPTGSNWQSEVSKPQS